MKKIAKKIGLLLSVSSLFVYSNSALSLPFSIEPQGEIPSFILPGETLYIFYKITNETNVTANGAFIKYLFPNSQIVPAPGTCGASATFNLAAHGNPGDSCILELAVTGPINDSCGHNNLFACFSDATSCSGAPDPLHIPEFTGPVPSTLYAANFDRRFITYCSVDANGNIIDSTCQQQNIGEVDAPLDIIFDKKNLPNYAYLVGLNGGINNSLTICKVKYDPLAPTDHSLIDCHAQVTPSFSQSNAGLAIHNGFLYITAGSYPFDEVQICPLTNGGASIGTCVSNSGPDASNNPTFNSVTSRIAFQDTLSGSFAYVANAGGENISICQVNPDGSLSNCKVRTIKSLPDPIIGLAIDASRTHLYVNNNDPNANNTLYSCDLLAGDLGSCQAFGASGFVYHIAPVNFFINNNLAYIPGYGPNQDAMATCTLFPLGSAILPCPTTTGSGKFEEPTSAWIATFINP